MGPKQSLLSGDPISPKPLSADGRAAEAAFCVVPVAFGGPLMKFAAPPYGALNRFCGVSPGAVRPNRPAVPPCLPQKALQGMFPGAAKIVTCVRDVRCQDRSVVPEAAKIVTCAERYFPPGMRLAPWRFESHLYEIVGGIVPWASAGLFRNNS